AVRAQPLKSLGPKPVPRHWEPRRPEWDKKSIEKWETGSMPAVPFTSWDDEDDEDMATTYDTPAPRATGKQAVARRESTRMPTVGGATEARHAVRGDALRQQAAEALGDDALATGLMRRMRSAKVDVVRPDAKALQMPGGIARGVLSAARLTS